MGSSNRSKVLIDKVTGKIAPAKQAIDREYIEGETAERIEPVNEQRDIQDKAQREPKGGVREGSGRLPKPPGRSRLR